MVQAFEALSSNDFYRLFPRLGTKSDTSTQHATRGRPRRRSSARQHGEETGGEVEEPPEARVNVPPGLSDAPSGPAAPPVSDAPSGPAAPPVSDAPSGPAAPPVSDAPSGPAAPPGLSDAPAVLNGVAPPGLSRASGPPGLGGGLCSTIRYLCLHRSVLLPGLGRLTLKTPALYPWPTVFGSVLTYRWAGRYVEVPSPQLRLFTCVPSGACNIIMHGEPVKEVALSDLFHLRLSFQRVICVPPVIVVQALSNAVFVENLNAKLTGIETDSGENWLDRISTQQSRAELEIANLKAETWYRATFDHGCSSTTLWFTTRPFSSPLLEVSVDGQAVVASGTFSTNVANLWLQHRQSNDDVDSAHLHHNITIEGRFSRTLIAPRPGEYLVVLEDGLGIKEVRIVTLVFAEQEHVTIFPPTATYENFTISYTLGSPGYATVTDLKGAVVYERKLDSAKEQTLKWTADVDAPLLFEERSVGAQERLTLPCCVTMVAEVRDAQGVSLKRSDPFRMPISWVDFFEADVKKSDADLKSEITRIWKKLALKLHPDKGGDDRCMWDELCTVYETFLKDIKCSRRPRSAKNREAKKDAADADEASSPSRWRPHYEKWDMDEERFQKAREAADAPAYVGHFLCQDCGVYFDEDCIRDFKCPDCWASWQVFEGSAATTIQRWVRRFLTPTVETQKEPKNTTVTKEPTTAAGAAQEQRPVKAPAFTFTMLTRIAVHREADRVTVFAPDEFLVELEGRFSVMWPSEGQCTFYGVPAHSNVHVCVRTDEGGVALCAWSACPAPPKRGPKFGPYYGPRTWVPKK